MSLSGLTVRRHSTLMKRLPKHVPAIDTEDPFAAAISSFFNGGDANPTPGIHKTASVPRPNPVTPTPPTLPPPPPPPGAPIDTPVTTTSTTSSTPTSNTHILTTNTANIKSPTTSVFSSTTSHPVTTGVKAQPSANSVSTATSTSSHSTGIAIGVTLTVVGLCAIGAILWVLRKRRMRERAQWRSSWNAGFQANPGSKRQTWLAANSAVSANSMSERRSYEPVTPTTPNMYKPLPDPNTPRGLFVAPPIPEPVTITMPSSTVNNPIHEAPKLIGNTSSFGGSNETARVRRGFLPSLPDELPISIGEIVQVLTAYDDGWSHCQNNRGEKGMVPLECLDRKGNGGGNMAKQEGASGQKRMSRRASSLYVGVEPQSGY